MTKEVKAIIKNVVKYDILWASILITFFIFFKKYSLSIIFFTGMITSMLNFVISAMIADKTINSIRQGKKNLFVIGYIFRIVIVVFIVILFSNKLSNLLAFLIGFIAHYAILTFASIKMQKGSE